MLKRSKHPYRHLLKMLVIAELSGPELTATFETLSEQAKQTADAASGGDGGGGETQGGDAAEAPTATEVPPPTNTVEPPPTVPGAPGVTANVDANVREGPSTDFKGVGALLNGQSATIEGKDPTGTWYNIIFPAGVGGKAWIAASTVTTSGDVSRLPIVSSPATYTSTPTNTATATATATATNTPLPITNTATATATTTATATVTASPTTELLWHGAWNVTCPPSFCSGLTLVQIGNNVDGSFSENIDAVLVEGTITGNTLTGTVAGPTITRSPFSWTLEPSGQQFKGTWGPLGDPFCGARQGTALPSCP